MADDHETHHAGGGTPDQVQTAVGQCDIAFAVDGARRCSKCGLFLCQFLKPDFFAIESWSSPPALRGRGHRAVGDSVALGRVAHPKFFRIYIFPQKWVPHPFHSSIVERMGTTNLDYRTGCKISPSWRNLSDTNNAAVFIF